VLTAAAAVLLAGLAAPAAPAPDPFAEALRAGEAAWARRGEPARLAAALEAFGRAAALRPGDPGAEVPLARAHAFRALAEPAEAARSYVECTRAAERALRRAAPGWASSVDAGEPAAKSAAQVGAEGAEPLYWLAACGMGLVRARGVAAVLSAKDELRPLMERAAALAPALDAAGPHRALGAWLAALPSAAGGGAAEARRHFDRARELAPDDPLRAVREAETWAVLVQDRALFLRLLDGAIAHDPARAPARAPESALAREQARALRAQVDRLF
jgi:hypothetical protein